MPSYRLELSFVAERLAKSLWDMMVTGIARRSTSFLLAFVLVLSVPFAISPAEAACTVPNQITNGQPADATVVMGNFNALNDCINSAVSQSGNPSAGNISVFSGPNAVTNGDLSGDCVTAGTLAVTCTKSNGVLLSPFATGTDASLRHRLRRANHPVRRVKVRAVSLVEAENRATENGNKMFYAMPTVGLEKALQYIAGGRAKTVNLSVSTPNRLHSVENAVLGNYDLLLIVASGNGAYDFDKVYRYPAATGHLTRAQAGRVIAVASHDKRGCLSSFSGRGKEIVDLAAPGEQIQAMGLGGQLMTSEGTSQATALTSFVAALIRANSDFTPASVKDRLTASVDLSPDLSPYVKSEGALNMRKALSLYDDVLELRGQPVMFGTLKLAASGPPLPELFCPNLVGDERHVLKVSKRVDGGDASQVRLLLRNDQKEGEVKAEYCVPSTATFEFRPITGAAQTFKLADVIDFVPLSLGGAQ